jgi:hypothetical protein
LHLNYKNNIVPQSLVLKSGLFVISLFLLIECLLLPVQLYGSAILCDPSLNLTHPTNCDERSSSSPTLDTETTDNSRSDNTETPLIIPDISPTNKDLKDATTDGDLGTTVTDATNDVNRFNDDDNDDDNDDSENPDTNRYSSNSEGGSSDNDDDNDDSENPDTDRDSSNSEGGSSDSKTSLIPFP